MNRTRDHERALFAAFLAIEPEFAGERLAEWDQPKDERDFPDIIGTSITGRKIGVEIGEWLNEEEIQAAKQKERREESILSVIGDQGVNPTKNISFVWLHPKPSARVLATDNVEFRKQLFACILDSDRRWPSERFWKIGRYVAGDELAAYPLLAKYLEAIKLWPADNGQWERNWITFPMRAGFFNRETMAKPLRDLVSEKISRYSAKGTGFDDLSLLLIYNQAVLYNSPAETPFHSYDDAAAELKQMVASNRGPFDRVFLYVALEPGRVLRVW